MAPMGSAPLGMPHWGVLIAECSFGECQYRTGHRIVSTRALSATGYRISNEADPSAMSTPTIVPVILSGGSGTRLWPVSRESFPKQLWPLLSDHSLMQETVLRARGPAFAAPVVVCNEEHRFLIAEQLREVGITNARIMLEPVGRNSAPAIAAAAILIAED